MRQHACSTLSPPSPSPSPSRVRVSRDSNRERRVAASSVKITNRISTREERRALFKGSYNKKQNTNKNIRRTAIIVNEAAGGRGDSASDDMYSMDVMDDSSSNKSGVGTEIMKAEKNTPRTLLPGVPLLSEEDSWLTKLITLCIGAVSFYAAFLAINTKESAEITGAIVAQFIIEAFGRFLGLTPAPSPDKIIRVYLEDAALLFFLGSVLRLSLFSGFFRFSERVQEIIKDIAGSLERGLLIASGSRAIGALLIGSAVFEFARITYVVQAITYLCILSGVFAAMFSWEKRFFASTWGTLEKSGAAPATLARVNGAERVTEIITWVVAAIFCFKAIGLNWAR